MEYLLTGRSRLLERLQGAVAPEDLFDEIPGIGPGRKRNLLAHFGSAKAVSRAGLPDLKAVDGISASMADAIYAFFHGER